MPVPEADAAVTLTFSPPVFFNVTVCDAVFSSTTLPKLMLVGLAVKSPDVTAVPVNGIDKFGFCAFDVTATSPVKVPVDCGAKVTLNETLCPAPSATGRVMPETLNPVPLAATAVICALVPPVFCIVSDCVRLFPTCTLVNVWLVGDAVNVAGKTPVPDSPMSTSASPLSVSATLPVTAPVVVGAKLMLKVAV